MGSRGHSQTPSNYSLHVAAKVLKWHKARRVIKGLYFIQNYYEYTK